MRAFASGCTAMTGVEAVSNGITAFREPGVVNAHRTLTVIVATLAVLLGGIAYLCAVYGIGAMDQGQPGYQSVLSQLVAAVFGQGRLLLRHDHQPPGHPLPVRQHQLRRLPPPLPAGRDRRLPALFVRVCTAAGWSTRSASSFLTGAAGLLLIGFGGITEHLIPLYAVGAFLAFTLSQAGMVCHWRRQLRTAKQGDCAIVGQAGRQRAGSGGDGGALAVILAAKFREGAWVTVLAFPVILGLFRLVKRYYKQVDRQIRTRKPLDLSKNEPPVVVVPTQKWNKLVDKALRFAVEMSPDVIAVHLFAIEGTEGDEQAGKLRGAVGRGCRETGPRRGPPAPPAGDHPVALPQVLRTTHGADRPGREQYPGRMIAVLVPEVVKTNWWQFLLHNYRGELLRSALLRHGDHRLVVVSVPWYVEDPIPTQPRSRPAATAESLRRPPAAHDGSPVALVTPKTAAGCCRPGNSSIMSPRSAAGRPSAGRTPRILEESPP